jgi:RNA polymerase sigma factor (sigma-70 family)
MSDEQTIQLWEVICRCSTHHSQRWSHLSSEDLASWAFLEVASSDGGLKEWVQRALRGDHDLESIARQVVNRVAKRLQRAQQKAILGHREPAAGELTEMLNELPMATRMEATRRLKGFLSELPGGQMQLLTAYYVDERPLSEIGAEHSLSSAAVANRLLRIRKRIIRFLEEISDLP